jgi:modulator of FtsH protease HflK
MELFNWIKELIVQGWSMVWPFYIIDEYQRGIILRWGVYQKHVTPRKRPQLKWPFADELFTVSIATETIQSKVQSLTTKDGKSITISLVIKYNIGEDEDSLKKYILKVRDVTDAIDDIAMSKAKSVIMELNWEDVKTNDIDKTISIKTRAEAKKWGVEIDYVVLVDLAESRNIRLMQYY